MSELKIGEAKQVLSDIEKLENIHDHDQANNARRCFVEVFGNYLIEQAEKVKGLEEDKLALENELKRQITARTVIRLEKDMIADELKALKNK